MFSITQLFDPSIGEYGQDYALPAGKPIYSPVAGTFATVDNGKSAWGKQAFVHMATAIGGISTFAVGHLTSFAAVAGQKIKAGDLIGYSGGALSDPSSGVSTGPHVETQFYNAQGSPINPKTVFAQFASWEQAIFSGKGAAASSSSASSSSTDINFPGGSIHIPNPLAGVSDAIDSATTSVENFAMRVSFTAIGVVVFIVGIGLIVLGDFEHIAQTGADAAASTAKAIAPLAEAAAA